MKHYLWFIINSETRFIIGFHLSGRNSPQAVAMLHNAPQHGKSQLQSFPIVTALI
ncbi:MAG: hypothetical protein GX783_07165 [Clostridiales bacterium]|nr:hypothetical protein [Clostridiales bacterium]